MACTAAILTAAACSTDISLVDDPGEVKIMLTANVGSTTRATTTNLNQSHIASGTGNVGVFIQKEGASSESYLLNNAAYSSDGKGSLTPTTPSSPVFPIDGTKVNIYAYTPLIPSSSPNEDIAFSVSTDQSEDADYIASDLMIGSPAQNPVAKTTSAIPLTFDHKMAKIVVDFSSVTTDLTGATLTTCGLYTSAKVNIKNKTITTDESAPMQAITIAKIDAQKTAACVIPPQKVAAGTKLLCLDYHGIKTYYTTPADITFESGKVYTFNMSKLTISTINLANLTGDVTLSMDCTITGTTSKKITIANGVKVTLDGVTINNQIVCQRDATIYLKGTNKVTSTNSDEAGIEAGPAGTTLTINGDADGSIEVKGGQNSSGIGSGQDNYTIGNITINGGIITATGGQNGAGIGSGDLYSSCGNITITGGTVNATGGDFGAGIGSGRNSSCGNISITGGTVTATGGFVGAGIGSGYDYSSCNNIAITGGTVTATGGNNGAGIGSGYKSSCVNITITGGTVNATGGDFGAGIGSGNDNSSCRDISIDMTGKSGYSINVKAGVAAYCIGNGSTNSSAEAITITNATITLDYSNSSGKYFNPTPTFVGTVVIKDTNDNDITGSITHN